MDIEKQWAINELERYRLITPISNIRYLLHKEGITLYDYILVFSELIVIVDDIKKTQEVLEPIVEGFYLLTVRSYNE